MQLSLTRAALKPFFCLCQVQVRLVANVLISPPFAGVSRQDVDFCLDLFNFSLYFTSLWPAVPLSVNILLSVFVPFLCSLQSTECVHFDEV